MKNIFHHKKFRVVVFLVIISFVFIFATVKVRAAGSILDAQHAGVSDACQKTGVCEMADFLRIGAYITNAIIGIIGVWALLMFVFGGVVWITSSGNPERVKQGKNVFVGSLIGLFVVFFSWTIVNLTICGVMGQTPSENESQGCVLFKGVLIGKNSAEGPWSVFPPETGAPTTGGSTDKSVKPCSYGTKPGGSSSGKKSDCPVLTNGSNCNQYNDSYSCTMHINNPENCSWPPAHFCKTQCNSFLETDCGLVSPAGTCVWLPSKGKCVNNAINIKDKASCYSQQIKDIQEALAGIKFCCGKGLPSLNGIYDARTVGAIKAACDKNNGKCSEIGNDGELDYQTYYFITNYSDSINRCE